MNTHYTDFIDPTARLRRPSPLPWRTADSASMALGFGGFIAHQRYRVDGDETSKP